MTNNNLLSFYDPYVYQILTTIVGKIVTVQTIRGSVRGSLKNVLPDHIVVESNGTPFLFVPSKLFGFSWLTKRKWREIMFKRINKLAIELPIPAHGDMNAAAAVQELLGGKFGEMSTLNNYMFQSFNFRNKKLKPFYELVASITAEEFGHVELVSNTINLLSVGNTFQGIRISLHFKMGRMRETPTILFLQLKRLYQVIQWEDLGLVIMFLIVEIWF